MMAVAAAVVAGSLMVAASAPFDHAFAHQHGAHLAAQFDASAVGEAELRDTGELPGVTASAGPFPSVALQPVGADGPALPTLTVVGRPGPEAGVDDLDLRAGRWPTKPGEIVLSTSFAGPATLLGTTLRASDEPGSQTLTVVGLAASSGRTADAWATPEQVRALGSADNPVTLQMLYRFAAAATDGQVAAGRGEIAEAVPEGALLGSQSYLDAKRAAEGNAAPTIPFLMAFGALGIAMSVIIVGSVVSGAVGTNLRRIGILKALGFTPGEVVRAYVAQALIPAAFGVALGVGLGNLMAVPLLDDTEEAYGDTSLSVAWWVDLLVPAAALLVVVAAALVPALRAGRLPTVEAIAVGRAPRSGRGRWAHRLAGRLPLPRAVTYGLASPFAHPVRAVAMLLAVAFGTVTATFAVGLTTSLNEVGRAQDPEERAAVTVLAAAPPEAHGPRPPAEATEGGGGGPGGSAGGAGGSAGGAGGPGTAVEPARVRAAIESQQGTASYYGMTQGEATVAGSSGRVELVLYEGDSESGAYAMISGHWPGQAGEAAVPTRFLERTGTRLGDTIEVGYEGPEGTETRTLRIVGELFDTSNDGMRVHAALGAFTTAQPEVYPVELDPGVSPNEYAEALAAVLRPLGGDVTVNADEGLEDTILILDAMAGLLTLMLVSVAGLGVLNSVVLDTRERVHDLGVCKALGMTPRQTVLLVLSSVAVIGVLGGLAGVPAGFALHHYVVPVMGHAAGTNLPASVLDVYGALPLTCLGLGGVLIALLGATLPAGRAARARTGTVLRTE
ncbi:ABC transporter permease [Streptomyces hoynatensis]|uniref:ABC transporter permease n=2 Tax=Streptomyces hoynatensis TaxID=1141874 RepID=A0A3A9ZFC3_9ACTN|nr:ABC transporter permease [Streptomyces hoynatensis]